MLYIKDNQIKNDFDIVLVVGGTQIINPTKDQLTKNGWKEYVAPEPTLDNIKSAKVAEITAYDTSNEVNVFYLDEKPMWLDWEKRTGLTATINAQKAKKGAQITLWFGDTKYDLPCDTATNLLQQVEVYALTCSNKTSEHKSNVLKLGSKEEVESYNYKTGYPEKLHLKTK